MNTRLAGLVKAMSVTVMLALGGQALAQQDQQEPTGTYTNPVIAPVAADPSVIRAPDGTWYLYATQDRWDDGIEHYLPVFSSSDLITWEFVADVFVFPPRWKQQGFLWAPDISVVDGVYHLYYSYSTWGDPNPCIGLATAPAPTGPWQDQGSAVFCSDDIGVRNSIDPYHHVAQDGARTLIWGSFNGIHAVELSADGTHAVGEPTRLADSRFEAAYLHERYGFYYLFLSSGSCCNGADSTYAGWVGRSESLLGPYLDDLDRDLRYGGGTIVLYRNDRWVGPGHNAVATDDAGADWIVYHAIDPTNANLRSGATRRPVLIDRIEWVDGWPVVNGGEGPSSDERPVPVVR